MRRLPSLSLVASLLLAAVALSGCFTANEPPCAFSCDYVAAGICPSGYSCQPDNYCHKTGHTGACPGLPGRDAAVADVAVNEDAELPCAERCPDGCCDGDTCVATPTAAQCGTGGAACVACDADLADSCVAGACSCGSGGTACAAGQHCGTGGACVCDSTSCDGCCDGTTCVALAAVSKEHCGKDGAACGACNALRGDRCLDGVCACGSGTECAAGQRCNGFSLCVCDTESGCSGCCDASNNCLGATLDHCGTGGEACDVCSGTYPKGNACTSGDCKCGSGSACNSDQQCNAGACECVQSPCCDVHTCPSGCCNAGVCQTASLTMCGSAGGSCSNCTTTYGNRVNRCDASGGCVCGSTGGQCAAGQECVGTGTAATCQCTAASCASGCCNGNQCLTTTRTNLLCGSGGGACGPCGFGADTCNTTTGVCECSTNSATVCANGQECTGSGCVCNAAACANGCCDSNTCHVNDQAACGTGGGACASCGASGTSCADGACMCGAAAACSGASDTCGAGNVCLCGADPACSGLSDTCTTGTCGCGAGSPCGSNADACDAGTCKCGVSPACSGTTDTCDTGTCKCGTGAACGAGHECVTGACVYSHTIVVDGTNDFVTGAAGAGEDFTTTSAGYAAYVTWDLDNLYIGYDGPDVASPGSDKKWVLVYLDTDPAGGSGLAAGQLYNTQQPVLPFDADYHVRWRTDDLFTGAMLVDTGAWAATTLAGLAHARAGSLVELKIPFADLGNPATLRVVTFMINEADGSEWTYAGLYSGSFTDGVDPDPANYLLIDRASGAFPNDAANQQP